MQESIETNIMLLRRKVLGTAGILDSRVESKFQMLIKSNEILRSNVYIGNSMCLYLYLGSVCFESGFSS